MLTIILIVSAAAVLGLLMRAATSPSELRVTRTASIKASSSTLFAQADDLKNWVKWSPFEKLDPNASRSFEGSPAGVGAVYAWSGNSKMGNGRLTITESQPCTLIRMRLEFLKPHVATNNVEFMFEEQGGSTLVTWSLAGERKFAMRLMSIFINFNQMIGAHFDEGLASLRSLAETSNKGA